MSETAHSSDICCVHTAREKISSVLQGSFAKETYNSKEPTNYIHPIAWPLCCICPATAPSAITIPHRNWLKRTHEVSKFQKPETFPVVTHWSKEPPPRGKVLNLPGFLFTMFPHQEPCVRGPPSKDFYQVLWKPPRGVRSTYSNSYVSLNFLTNESFSIQKLPRSTFDPN